jgi:hypothetical protein
VLDCWGRGFESRSWHGCLSCLYVVLSCAGRGVCDGLITRPEESYRVSCMCYHRNPEKWPYVPRWEREENDSLLYPEDVAYIFLRKVRIFCTYIAYDITTQKLSSSCVGTRSFYPNCKHYTTICYFIQYLLFNNFVLIKLFKQSRYTPWRRLGGEEV